MPDLKDLLKRPTDDIKPPQPLPAGTYFGTIIEHLFKESAQKKTPGLELTIRVTGHGDDVDPGDVKDLGIDLHTKTFRHTFYITEDSLYRLKQFWESCGIEGGGRSLGEIIPDLQGCNVQFTLIQKPNRDGSAIYNEISQISGQQD
jgi:hypothetical protein